MKYIKLLSASVYIIFCVSSCFQDDTQKKSWNTSVITPVEVTAYAPVNADTFPYNDPSLALGLPRGAGQTSGSTHIVSLGFDDANNRGYIILRFSKKIINGPGADFKVFENVMQTGATEYFIEAAHVCMLPSTKTFLSSINVNDVTAGSTDWEGFPCTLSGTNTSPQSYTGCAGLQPVISNSTKQDSTPLPEADDSGGDFFDLADLPADSSVKTEGFYYIMIIDAGLDIDDPGIASIFGYGGFDLDAVVGINYE